jgi:hypothetical protein
MEGRARGGRRVILMREQNGEGIGYGKVEVVGDDRKRWRERMGGSENGEGWGKEDGAIRAVVHKGL